MQGKLINNTFTKITELTIAELMKKKDGMQ